MRREEREAQKLMVIPTVVTRKKKLDLCKTQSCPKTAPSEAKRRERQKKYFAGAYFISK
jgi:hypothetical protein